MDKCSKCGSCEKMENSDVCVKCYLKISAEMAKTVDKDSHKPIKLNIFHRSNNQNEDY